MPQFGGQVFILEALTLVAVAEVRLLPEFDGRLVFRFHFLTQLVEAVGQRDDVPHADRLFCGGNLFECVSLGAESAEPLSAFVRLVRRLGSCDS
jgi:hypothetical protein